MEDSQDQNNQEEYQIEPEEDEMEQSPGKKDKLKQEIERLKKEKEEYLQGWQRERAAFANFRKDEDKRMQQAKDFNSRNLLLLLVDSLGIFEALEESVPEGIREAAWFEKDFTVVRKHLEQQLSSFGVSEIPVQIGEAFDPQIHEALEQVESDKPSGAIVQILQKGYRLNDSILR